MNDLTGVFDIEFIGGRTEMAVNIRGPVVTTDATVLWLEGVDGKIYNWSTITTMVRLNPPALN